MKRWVVSVAIVLFALAAHADVSITYKFDISMASFMPGQEQVSAALKGAMPTSMEIRVKGGKAYSTAGRMFWVMDLAKQEITLIDAENKHFATVAMGGYMKAIMDAVKVPEMPAQAKAFFESMKFSADHKSTGRTEVIQGVQAEETEYTFTMEMPLPAAPAGGNDGAAAMPQSMQMRMVMSMWMAKPEEVVRTPAVHELAGFMSFIGQVMNPSSILQQFSQMMPGMADKIQPVMKDMFAKPSAFLRSRVAIYMPFMAAMAQQMEKMGKPLPAGFDPNGPMMEQTMEAIGISSAAVDEALFQVPADYTEAPFAEVMKAMVPTVARKTQ